MTHTNQKNGGAVFVGMIIIVIFLVFLTVGIKDLLPKRAEQSDMTRTAARTAETAGLSRQSAAKIAQSDFAFYAGSSNPRVRVVEFLDFQCPYCKNIVPTVHELMDMYQGAPVQFSFRHFPIESIHPLAFEASHASLCAKEQNKFLQYHDLLYEQQDAISAERLSVFAAAVGLDGERFSQCMAEARYASTIRKDLSDGVVLGALGTPTFFINGIKIEGAQSRETFTNVINQELQ